MSDDLVVLVVDDDFHVGRLHAGFVNAVPGFTALTPVGTAEQAMRTVHAHQPDLHLRVIPDREEGAQHPLRRAVRPSGLV